MNANEKWVKYFLLLLYLLRHKQRVLISQLKKYNARDPLDILL